MTDPNFAFEKQLGLHEVGYGNLSFYLELIHRLFVCMQETNKLHGTTCEFFRLDFRTQFLDEELTHRFPMGALVFDLKWGSKKELEEKKQQL